MVADLRAESDELDALVAELPAERWADAHTGAGLDDRTPDRAPAVDRPRRADRRHRRSRVSPRVLEAAAANPTGFVDEGAEELAATPPDAAARRLARHPGPAARRTAGRRRRPQAAVVRAADERRVDGHRPADGDLGARPRRRRCARGEAARHGAVALDRPHRRAHPRLRVRGQRADPAARSRSGWSCGRPTARRGRGARTTPRSGSPDRRRTSACWSPSGGRGRRWT